MKDLSLLELLKSGAHFGHKTSRWNPKMKPYIFAVRNDIHILDLEQTKKALIKAAEFAKKTAQNGGTILFVGTKRQAKDIVKAAAEACGMPYVNVRWLGGTFTNWKTIQKTVRKLEKLQDMASSDDFETRYTKKERLLVTREIEKLTKLFEGIKNLKRLPEAVFVTDVNYDDIAVLESVRSKVPVIGVVDSNSNPGNVNYPIPANDDATAAIALIANIISDSISEGRQAGAAIQEAAPVVAAV